MAYSIKQLAQLAGVSTRTLRYYDEIGLLPPAYINDAGYRFYEQKQVDLLQHILFYRELDVSLETIRAILTDPQFDEVAALCAHEKHLRQERDRLNRLIETVEQTIKSKEGGETMQDEQKFTAFKEKLVAVNEETYAKEVRDKYGDDVVDAANEKMLQMSRADYEGMQAEAVRVQELLKKVSETSDDERAKLALAEAHRAWLMYTWKDYTKEAHAGLAEMYVADERFAAYYNDMVPNGAVLLRDAIIAYTKQ
ncbi:MerR family transcriptional regulator [Bacillus sp. FSL W7-1360]